MAVAAGSKWQAILILHIPGGKDGEKGMPILLKVVLAEQLP
jgi:hypothetical protein